MLKDLPIMMPRFGLDFEFNLGDQSRASFKKAKQICRLNFAHRLPTPVNPVIPSSRVDKVLTEDILILELHPTTLSNWSGDKEAFKEGVGEMATVTSKVRQKCIATSSMFSLGQAQ